MLFIFHRLLLQWSGNSNSKFLARLRVWAKADITKISHILVQFNNTLPREIHRKIRSLHHIHYWKASEYRTLMLYVGIVFLKDIIPEIEYQLFLKLFCAVTISSCEYYRFCLPLARVLYLEYIEGFINCYGLDTITSNIHNLSHVIDDVEMFGNLSKISAYDFENALHQIKLLLKQCNKPLEQVARRLYEIDSRAQPVSLTNIFTPQVKFEFDCPQSPNNVAFRRIIFKPNTSLSSDIKNQWFLLKNNNTIAKFECAYKIGNRYIIRAFPLNVSSKQDFFTRPINSSHLNIFLSDIEETPSQHYELCDIKAKLFCLPYKDRFVFMPLLHSLD